MSSVSQAKIITKDDFGMMQRVLTKAGYTANMLTQPRNAATMLFVRLFEEGTREPAAFAMALENHFGKPKPDKRIYQRPLHQFAIQGRQTKMDRPKAHRVDAAAGEVSGPVIGRSNLMTPLIEVSVVAAVLLAASAVFWLSVT